MNILFEHNVMEKSEVPDEGEVIEEEEDGIPNIPMEAEETFSDLDDEERYLAKLESTLASSINHSFIYLFIPRLRYD